MYINKKNSTHTNKTKLGITENIYIYIYKTLGNLLEIKERRKSINILTDIIWNNIGWHHLGIREPCVKDIKWTWHRVKWSTRWVWKQLEAIRQSDNHYWCMLQLPWLAIRNSTLEVITNKNQMN